MFEKEEMEVINIIKKNHIDGNSSTVGKDERIMFMLLDHQMQPFSKYKEVATSILAKIKLFEEYEVVEKARVRKEKIVCKGCGEEHADIELEGTVKMTFDCHKCNVRNVIIVDNAS